MLVTIETVGALVDRIMSEPEVHLAYDTETTGRSPVSDRVVGFSVSCGNRHGVYLPFRHERILEEEVQVKQGRKKLGPPKILRSEPHPANLPKEVMDTVIRAIVESKRIVALHKAEFDLSMSHRDGWLIPNKIVDTRVAKWLLCRGVRPLGHNPFGLKTLAKKDLGHEMKTFEETSDPRGFQYTDPVLAAEYSADDARSTWRLWNKYKEEMWGWEKEGFLREFLELEMPVSRVLDHMRRTGICLDKAHLERCHEQVVAEQAKIQAKLDEIVKGSFPTSKTQKLSRLMYDQLKWWNPRGKERGKARAKDDPVGFYSTDEESLREQLTVAHDKRGKDIAMLLLRWRKLETLRARYTIAFIEFIDVDGRVRSSFNQASTDTGRFTSREPPLQVLPRPSDDESPDVWVRNLPKIRDAFYAPKGKKLLDVDYGQIELRLMAHYSQDQKLLEAYRTWKCGVCGKQGETDVVLHACPACGAKDTYEKYVADDENGCPVHVVKKGKMGLGGTPQKGCFCLGMDIHQLTASQVGCDRQAAKAINFGLIYGMSAWLLAKYLRIPQSDAERYVARYFNSYPGVRNYHRTIEKQLLERWYVRTLTGRHRKFDKCEVDRSEDGRPVGKYGHTFRAAVNATIQGSAADLMKLAMRNLYRKMVENGELEKRFWILSTVHDELICEVTDDYAEEAKIVVRDVFEHVVRLRVPLVAEPALGHRWTEVH